MNQKIPFYELAKKIAETNSITQESAEVFLKHFFDLIGNSIIEGESVKINGIGTFSVEKNQSGENIVNFTLDKEISDTINAPFLSFEPVELNEDVTEEMLSNVDAEEEENPASVEEYKTEEAKILNVPSETIESDKPIETQTVEGASQVTPSEAVSELVESETVEYEPVETEPVVIASDESESVESEPVETASTESEFVESEPVETASTESEPAESEPVASVEETAPTPISTPLASEPQIKTAILEEEPEEYVEHVSEDGETNNGGFGWGFLVGLLVGLALGACAVYLAIDYIFPYGRMSDSTELYETDMVFDEITDNPTLTDTATVENTEPAESSPTPANEEAVVTEPAKAEEKATVKAAPAVVTDTIRPKYLLVQMAKKHYGSKDFWAYIYEENKSKIGNPNKVNPGTVLVIPPAEKYGIDANNPESLKRAKAKVGEILSKFK